MTDFLSGRSAEDRKWRTVHVDGVALRVPRWPETRAPSFIFSESARVHGTERRLAVRAVRAGVLSGQLRRREMHGGGCVWPEIGEAQP